jgi:hypothetical protein
LSIAFLSLLETADEKHIDLLLTLSSHPVFLSASPLKQLNIHAGLEAPPLSFSEESGPA